MATEDNKPHPAFPGAKVEAIDHKNPPKPNKPEKSKQSAPHFSNEPIQAVDVHNPPQAPSGAATKKNDFPNTNNHEADDRHQ